MSTLLPTERELYFARLANRLWSSATAWMVRRNPDDRFDAVHFAMAVGRVGDYAHVPHLAEREDYADYFVDDTHDEVIATCEAALLGHAIWIAAADDRATALHRATGTAETQAIAHYERSTRAERGIKRS